MIEMDVLITNGLVLPLNGSAPIAKGYVAIKDGRIAAVSAGIADPELLDSAGELIDATDCVIMPGFINSHTHLAMHFYRAFAEEQPYALYRIIVPMERGFDSNSMYWASTLGAMDALKSGTTCVVDHYHFADSTARAAKELGLRALIAEKIAGFSLESPPRWNAGLGEFDFPLDPTGEKKKLDISLELLERWAHDDLIIPCLGPHAPDTVSRNILERVRDAAEEHDCRILIHCAQSQAELTRVKRLHGMDSIAYLADIDFLGERVTAAHCVHIGDENIDAIARTRTHVVNNAMINAKDGCIAPLAKLLEAGARVSLGTDCYSMDMMEQMRWALVLGNLRSRLSKGDGLPPITAEDVLHLTTSKAADCLGLSHICGRLVVGLRADVIVIDRSMSCFLPPAEAYKDIVYNCSAKDVVHVIVNGQAVVKDRRLMGGDEKALVAEATARARKWFGDGQFNLAKLGLRHDAVHGDS